MPHTRSWPGAFLHLHLSTHNYFTHLMHIIYPDPVGHLSNADGARDGGDMLDFADHWRGSPELQASSGIAS